MNLRTFAITAVMAGVVASCNYDTPLRRVSFYVQAAGPARDPSGPPTYHTAQGWDVTLASAQISLGPIYFYDGSPMVGTAAGQGRVVSEVLSLFVVDVLDPAPRLVAFGDGTNQPANSALARLAEDSSGPIADVSGPDVAVAHVAGVAVRDDVAVSFDGVLALPMAGTVTSYQHFSEHQITQIPASFVADQRGTLTIRIDPSHWFDLVAFDTLCRPGQTAPCDFTSPSATTQLEAGIAAGSSFAFTWTPSP